MITLNYHYRETKKENTLARQAPRTKGHAFNTLSLQTSKGGKYLSKTGTKDQGQCIHYTITTDKAMEEKGSRRQTIRVIQHTLQSVFS